MANTTKKKTTKRAPKGKKEQPFFPYILAGIAITIVLIVAIQVDKYFSEQVIDNVNLDCDFCREATAHISSTGKLNDLNDIQLAHAKRNGLGKRFKTDDEFLAEANNLVREDKLVKISENKYYHIKQLTHSHPYLTPEAALLLQEIGYNFQQKLHEKGLPKYKITVSSVLRTEESQKKLQKVNYQATASESTHYYGTTFDINYNRFERLGIIIDDAQLEQLLRETLIEMRKNCRLLVVNEKRNKCYHITVVKCKNS